MYLNLEMEEVISNSDSSNADKDKRQRPKKTGEKRSEEKSKKDVGIKLYIHIYKDLIENMR